MGQIQCYRHLVPTSVTLKSTEGLRNAKVAVLLNPKNKFSMCFVELQGNYLHRKEINHFLMLSVWYIPFISFHRETEAVNLLLQNILEALYKHVVYKNKPIWWNSKAYSGNLTVAIAVISPRERDRHLSICSVAAAVPRFPVCFCLNFLPSFLLAYLTYSFVIKVQCLQDSWKLSHSISFISPGSLAPADLKQVIVTHLCPDVLLNLFIIQICKWKAWEGGKCAWSMVCLDQRTWVWFLESSNQPPNKQYHVAA